MPSDVAAASDRQHIVKRIARIGLLVFRLNSYRGSAEWIWRLLRVGVVALPQSAKVLHLGAQGVFAALFVAGLEGGATRVCGGTSLVTYRD